MEKVATHCALCNDLLTSIEFNLKSTNSKLSQVPLLSIVERVAGPLGNFHFSICIQCYNLINELDAIEIRQAEIRNRFKKYVAKCKLNSPVVKIENVISTVDNNVISEINDINLFDCNDDIVKNNMNNDLVIQETDVKSDIDFFNSDLINIKLNNYTENGNKLPTDSPQLEKPIAKKKGKRKKYPDIPKPHKCHCSKGFRTMGELKNHMITHDSQRQFICEICGQSYKHKAAFNIHMDMHNGINPFTCIYCNKSFTQKGALVRHVPIHTGEMPYQCDECGKRFIHHTSFNVHRLSHTGRKSYKCTVCGLALMSGSHLKRHMRIHTGEKKFACSVCGKRFAERYNLAVHEKLHTNPGSVPQKRKYSCQVCGAIFERKIKLNEHLVKEHQTIKLEVQEKE